ncbi:helicase-exonuclease AddAB subunit AddA [Paenibacillus doosanensis]|uniref:helicase-exonuclease AddAB subunit AddA n=1 Tax=Paenibacillus doosanensis TaxID=1229154 RepID=UPI00217FE33F|nr:helicase-exonuclease AddAB subunit AddA [Paenibacillus doosanensis]MCS7464882.1 helicase-exonuclease AddAB subunit AddA [Paenibacillus doosanensis]
MMNRIPKPEGAVWTDDQWDAIAIHGHDMLVAAAAGSGKTAVLVERIIRRISDEREPVDVDRLLVATFTNAAAAEMRHRISEALEKALERNPGSDHLRRQLALIGRASITTLHSFCLEVIHTHYQKIALDPGFRIANETESELMRQDLIEELFEEQYGLAEEGGDFWRLVEWFGGEKSDDAVYRLVQRLYDESRSHPRPAEWLREMAELFVRAGGKPNPWLPSLLASVKLELEGVASTLREAMRLAEQPGGPEPYMVNLREDLDAVRYLQDVAGYSWEHLYDSFQGTSFGKLKPCRGDGYDKALQEQVKELRNQAKEQLTELGEELFQRTPEQYDEELSVLAPLMKALVELVIEFGRRYQEAKKAKGLVDFGDLEHYCLDILAEDGEAAGELKPSQAALHYREHFAEVLLDEYQDTNRVQEAIVALISRTGPGNRFMVGDVKQSIYRFRLAEPGLFLEKYKHYQKDGTDPGQRIDLAQNFRSRLSVVHGVNYIFKQLMGETVGEIAYDERAELKYGASYYPEWPGLSNGPEAAEFIIIDRSEADGADAGDRDGGYAPTAEQADANGEASEGLDPASEAKELETVQLEARAIAAQIHQLLGTGGGPAFQVFDKSTGGRRDITFRDMVILLRATQQWSPVLIEELRLQGIPAYAELSTGYFSATEVEAVLSLLKVIDNPYQDIPLAAVLRSPIVQLDTEQLARIRIEGKYGSFYDAVRAFIKDPEASSSAADLSEGNSLLSAIPEEEAGENNSGLQVAWMETAAASESAGNAYRTASRPDDAVQADARAKLVRFANRLRGWREAAKQGPLSELIWNIYRQTGYYDFVGGLPGGAQRQANLRALYDRARQYEATSFRGLFRFLRFVERMKDSGGDLGTARALGEQEDVVRIMSIHKSKGLEFPVVFVAGAAKRFNQRDLSDPFMVHKDLGFGPKFMDAQTRISYPTLPWLAIRRKMKMEMLAEEMRVLYVALTRAREKLYLLATVKGTDKLLHSWARVLEHDGMLLPDDLTVKAKSYLDWIGPALMRHPDGERLRERAGVTYRCPAWLTEDRSQWLVHFLRPESYAGLAEAAAVQEVAEERRQAVLRLEPVEDGPEGEADRFEAQVWSKLSWAYSHEKASSLLSKTSVTELKRLSEHHKLLEMMSGEPEAPMLAGLQKETPQEYRPAIVRRPRFMEKSKLTAAERGTVFHSVMQYIRLDEEPTANQIRETLAEMLRKQLLTEAQREAVDPDVVVSFFRSPLGQRMLKSPSVHREVPFSYGLPAGEIYAGADQATAGETILLQGVIDCVFEEQDGLVLLDYKTDHLKGGGEAALQAVRERYRLQLDLYGQAIERIWKKPVTGTYIFLFDGPHLLEM